MENGLIGKRNPLNEFITKKVEAECILKDLLEFVSNHTEVDPDNVEWGNVGDMGYLIDRLTEINEHFGRL